MPPTKTALITGGSKGIGLALAHHYAAEGYDLVLVARNSKELQAAQKNLEDTHSIKVWTVAADLSQDGSVTKVLALLKKHHLSIHSLVNNAGFGDFAPVAEAEWSKLQQMLQVNVVTLTELTHRLLPEMIDRGSGQIVNIASTAAFLPGPLMSVYYASKAYVLSFSQGLAEEVVNQGITVTAVCPGPTKTSFSQRAQLGKSKLFTSQTVMSVEEVAREAYAAIQSGQRLVIPGWRNKLIPIWARLLPLSWQAKLVKQLQST